MHGDKPFRPLPQKAQENAVLALALVHMSIATADQPIALVPLAGGVSSDVYRVDLPSGSICVKRALPKLMVAADWRVPVERNHWEVEWMRVAGDIVPDAVPAILGEDRATGCFAMTFLAPDRHPVWKGLLQQRRRIGRISPGAFPRRSRAALRSLAQAPELFPPRHKGPGRSLAGCARPAQRLY